MKIKVYNSCVMLIALLALNSAGFAQDNATPEKPADKVDINLDLKPLQLTLANLGSDLKELKANITANVEPAIHGLLNDVHVYVNNSISLNEENAAVSERTKNYTKTYSIDGNDKIAIDNRYGKVVINTWNRNEVKVDVEIKSYADDDQTAQRMIDAITISDSKDGNGVAFRTNFGRGDDKSIWDLFSMRNDHHKSEVNYTVYMPSGNPLDLRNRYGAVTLPSLSGKVSIDNSYGSITAQKLTNPGNEFNFRYYEVDIDELGGAAMNLSYGSLKLGTVGKLEANVRYAPIDIGRLNSSGSFNIRYGGGIKINGISKGLKNLDINSSYSSVNINLKGDEQFTFDVTIKNSSFKYDEDKVKLTSKSPNDERGYHPTKNYKGYMGNSNANAQISINSTYESVKFE